jgi:multidrug efflux pump subunit AcrB
VNALLHTLTAISFRRVRPVLVTGCTTVLAMLPLVLQSEHGFWRTLGATVIGGVVWPSFFLVLTVPILLLLFARRPKQVPASLEALQSEQ